MPNTNYVKGRRKEYSIVKEYRLLGYDLVQRTAGSHSAIDVIAIDKENKVITLIQSKPDTMNKGEIDKIISLNKGLNGEFKVSFIVV